MIRQAKKTDFEAVFPILKQIFEEMELESIAQIPEGSFYELVKKGFSIEDYRYSFRRILVHETDGKVDGMLASYSYDDEPIIDQPLEPHFKEYGIPMDLKIFTDQESKPEEWYVDALAVHPDAWGRGIGGKLLDAVISVAQKNGYKKISLNVDKTNPHARHLYEKKNFIDVGELPIGDHLYDHMIKEI